ncbi:hypothetical protein [Arthrobacter sp. PL16]|uniref:hypothetical protein n=1 Tax=Arthrobacter sp. PL16 TaxID=3071720 RepID=UPI002E10B77D
MGRQVVLVGGAWQGRDLVDEFVDRMGDEVTFGRWQDDHPAEVRVYFVLIDVPGQTEVAQPHLLQCEG